MSSRCHVYRQYPYHTKTAYALNPPVSMCRLLGRILLADLLLMFYKYSMLHPNIVLSYMIQL
jgi:hypothetical protein